MTEKTKQEVIREDVARTFYEESDVRKTIYWLDLTQETRDSFFYKADNLLGRLSREHNLVIKVEPTEMEKVIYAGYVAVEELI